MKFHIYILSLLIIVLSSSLVFADGERVETKCEVGIDNQVKEHTWHNLYVTLENHYPKRMEVVVTVTRKVSDQPLLKMEQLVTLDSGDKQNKIKIEFACPPVKKVTGLFYTILVRDKSTNSTLLKYYNRKHHKIIRNEREIWIGKWMEQDKITLNTKILGQNDEQILSINAMGSSKLIRKILENTKNEYNEYIVAQRQVDDLPTNWLLIEGIKLIILNNPKIDKLQFGGRDQALASWVKAGGTLIYILSEKAEEYKNLKITNVAGVKLKSLETTQKLYEVQPNSKNFAKRSIQLDGSYKCIDADIVDPESTLTMFWGSINKNGKTQQIPIVNVRWVGSGKIITVLIDLQSSLNEAIPTYLFSTFVEPIFCNLVKEKKSNEKPSYLRNDYTETNESYYDEDVTSINIDMQYRFGNLINNIQQAKPIKFGIIAIFIGIYMIVIAFVDFILLKFMSLLHWTWLSVLLWVIAFSLIADKIGETFRGGEMSQREIAIVDNGISGDFTKYNQYAGVFSQQNQSYTVYHENPDSGITRFERIVSQELDYDDYDYDYSYNRKSEISVKNRSVDEQTEYVIAQPSDIEKLKHQGSYLKSVILPRWVIRDIQAKSIIDNSQKQGLSMNLSDEIGYYDKQDNIYSVRRRRQEDLVVKTLTVKNNYPYPLFGLCVIYSGGKIAFHDGIIGSNKSVIFYYCDEQDILLNSNPAETNYYYNNEQANSISLFELTGQNDLSTFKNWFRSDRDVVSIYPDTRNNIHVQKEFLLAMVASCRKVLANNYFKTSSKRFSYLGIQSNALGSLDISHRIESGETVILSWTNWHQHKKLDLKDAKLKENEEDLTMLESWYKKSEYMPSQMQLPKLAYPFPSINFEGWHPAVNRFIVNRHFSKPLSYYSQKK